MKRKIIALLATITLLFGVISVPVQAADEADILQSIDDGIVYLASVQLPDGSWPVNYGGDELGTTAFALVKLQERAIELGYSPFDSDYPYYSNIQAGFEYLFVPAVSVDITPQNAGDPDTDGDGLGVFMNVGARANYSTGALMMAIAAGRDPAQVVPTGALAGWSFGDALQDMVDWMAYAQTDTGDGAGGWYYAPQNGGGMQDMSNAGYSVLGLLYAQAPLYGYACTVPDFVKTELDGYIDYIQSDWDDGINPDYDGGAGYTGPDSWVNSLKTGNLLTMMAFVGDDSSTERAQAALEYIGNHWSDNWIQGWGKGTASVQYQALYCLMKGFETMAVSESDVPGVADWYDDMANDILAQQVTTAGPSFGSWPSSPAYVWPDGTLGHMVHPALSTVWALLTLERFAPPPPVIEVSLDIHPTSCPNPFNVNGKGVIPVAILGTEDFDVTMIDPASLLLEGIAPLRWAMEDVATPYGEFSDPPGCMECTEEGRDGYMDLTVKFKMQEVAAAISGVEDGDCIVLNITGNLKEDFGGTEIVGSDVVRIIKKK